MEGVFGKASVDGGGDGAIRGEREESLSEIVCMERPSPGTSMKRGTSWKPVGAGVSEPAGKGEDEGWEQSGRGVGD